MFIVLNVLEEATQLALITYLKNCTVETDTTREIILLLQICNNTLLQNYLESCENNEKEVV